MSNEFSIEEVYEFKKHLQKVIDKGEALKRLEQNSDYKLVFTEGYLEVESKRLVLMLGDPASDSKDRYIEQMIGIAQFANYVRSTKQVAEQAIAALEDANKAEVQYYEELKGTE